MSRIVVVGAGVVGLTTALLAKTQNPEYAVTIVAKHMPGDYSIEYSSPWAGANYLPMSSESKSRWERNTWPELYRLAKDVPEAGIHFQNTMCLVRTKDKNAPPSATSEWLKDLFSPTAWFRDVVPDFRSVPKTELAPGLESATAFTSVCINTAIYLPYLLSRCLAAGVVIKRGVLDHITDAASLHHSGQKADVVVNCTGVMASRLGGVMDAKVQPARGQTVLVRNDPGIMLTVSGTDDAADEVCYIMKRAAGGGTILGGTYQMGNWNGEPDMAMAERIMKRAVAICPALTNGGGIEKLDVIRHGVGLRPVREGGVRIESEKIGGVEVVHNYGHGGYGYQTSWETARDAVELVSQALKPKARL